MISLMGNPGLLSPYNRGVTELVRWIFFYSKVDNLQITLFERRQLPAKISPDRQTKRDKDVSGYWQNLILLIYDEVYQREILSVIY